MSKTHRAGEVIEFCARYSAQIAEVRFKMGDYISVVLARYWDEAEGRGEAGPWSFWGGYTARKIKDIAASIADSQTGRIIWKRGKK